MSSSTTTYKPSTTIGSTTTHQPSSTSGNITTHQPSSTSGNITTHQPSSTSGNITTHQPSSTYSYTTTPYPATTSQNFPPIPPIPILPPNIPEVFNKVMNVVNTCTNNPTDINNLDICFRGIDTITGQDIENYIKLINQYAPKEMKEEGIKTLEDWALFFNRNQEILEDGVNAFGNVIDLSKNALKALNNEVLKSSSVKFNVNEIDNIKNKLIKKLGGVSNKKYMTTMIMFIIMTLVVIGILLYNIFYKRK